MHKWKIIDEEKKRRKNQRASLPFSLFSFFFFRRAQSFLARRHSGPADPRITSSLRTLSRSGGGEGCGHRRKTAR